MSRVKIAIVGLNFGRHILEQLQTEPAKSCIELAAVCDMDRKKAEEAAAKYGVPYYTSIDELLGNAEIPAIGLYTGPNGRAGLIRQLIRAGKDVMTTKPFELDPAAAADVLQEAAKLGRVVHLNSPSPTLPNDLQQLEKWRTHLNLGRPVAARADVTVRYNEKADGSWYDDPHRCPVAPIFRLGIYLINDLIRICGLPESVIVVQSRIFTGRPTSDNAALSIFFKNGAIGNVFASFCVDDGQLYRNSLTVNFERGTVYRNVGPVQGKQRLQVVMKKPDGSLHAEEMECPEPVSGAYQWEVFARAVRGEKIGDLPPEQIVAGVQVLAAMMRAERSGLPEKVA